VDTFAFNALLDIAQMQGSTLSSHLSTTGGLPTGGGSGQALDPLDDFFHYFEFGEDEGMLPLSHENKSSYDNMSQEGRGPPAQHGSLRPMKRIKTSDDDEPEQAPEVMQSNEEEAEEVSKSEQETNEALLRMCSVWGNEMPALLELSHDAVMLIDILSTDMRIIATNPRFTTLVLALGCGDPEVGKDILLVSISLQLQHITQSGLLNTGTFDYSSTLVTCSGGKRYVQGSAVMLGTGNQCIFAINDVTPVIDSAHAHFQKMADAKAADAAMDLQAKTNRGHVMDLQPGALEQNSDAWGNGATNYEEPHEPIQAVQAQRNYDLVHSLLQQLQHHQTVQEQYTTHQSHPQHQFQSHQHQQMQQPAQQMNASHDSHHLTQASAGPGLDMMEHGETFMDRAFCQTTFTEEARGSASTLSEQGSGSEASGRITGGVSTSVVRSSAPEAVFNKWANGNGTACKVEPRQCPPYRFCRKCWSKDGSWKLRSIKLISENTSTFINGHTNTFCPSWGEDGEELEEGKAKHKQYSAAFKRAQQSSELHNIAFKALKEMDPSLNEDTLNEYLTA